VVAAIKIKMLNAEKNSLKHSSSQENMIIMKKTVITKRLTAKKLKKIKGINRNKNKKYNKSNNLNIKMIRENENKPFIRMLNRVANSRINRHHKKEIILNNSSTRNNQLLSKAIIAPLILFLSLNPISKLNCNNSHQSIICYILQNQYFYFLSF